MGRTAKSQSKGHGHEQRGANDTACIETQLGVRIRLHSEELLQRSLSLSPPLICSGWIQSLLPGKWGMDETVGYPQKELLSAE